MNEVRYKPASSAGLSRDEINNRSKLVMDQLRSFVVGQTTAATLFAINNSAEPYASSIIKKFDTRHLWRTDHDGKMQSLGLTFTFGYLDAESHTVVVCTLKFAGSTTERIKDAKLESVEWAPAYR